MDHKLHIFGFADSIIDGVYLKYKFLVEKSVRLLQLLLCEVSVPNRLSNISDDFSSVVFVDETSARESYAFILFVCVVPGVREAFLVMVKAQLFWQVLSPDINYYVERVQDILIARSHNQRVLVLFRVQKHRAGEHFIAVECVAMGADHCSRE